MRVGVLLVCAIGCKGKEPPTPTTAPAGSTAPAVTASAPDAALVDALDARCVEACLFLTDLPLAQAKQTYEQGCGARWPYVETSCETLLFARNCIYAARGNVFKKPEWKDRFAKLAWYKPRPDFKESDLSAAAMANIKELKRTYEGCGLPEVTADDKALVTKVLEEASVTNDAVIEIDGVGFRKVSDRIRNHVIVDESTVVYVKKPTADSRTIEVGNLMHAVGPGKLDEDLVVQLTFDADNALRAIKIP